jgi:large subunit ribosomal protein L7/L12
MAITKEDVVQFIENMTVLDLSELVKELEEKFGVSAAAPMAMAMPAAGGEAAEAEEQTEFDVKITEIGAQKLQVIKAVRSLTDLGLKEAKALVDATPSILKEGVSKEEGEEIKAKIEAAGGKVELV